MSSDKSGFSDKSSNLEGISRPCLKCSRNFKSAHKFNRLCRKCKNKDSSSEWATWGGEVMYDGSVNQ